MEYYEYYKYDQLIIKSLNLLLNNWWVPDTQHRIKEIIALMPQCWIPGLDCNILCYDNNWKLTIISKEKLFKDIREKYNVSKIWDKYIFEERLSWKKVELLEDYAQQWGVFSYDYEDKNDYVFLDA